MTGVRSIGRFFRILSRALNAALVLSLAIYGAALYFRHDLPPPDKIIPQLENDPVQRTLSERPFTFSYAGREYQIVPHASYVISGLLVSHNDISSVFDAYHDKDSVDVRDICLIWGENLEGPEYLQVSFWNETWSCHYKIEDEQIASVFRGDQLSNNHLLAGNSEVKAKILSAFPGDQIRISGKLVDYFPVGASEQVRETSLVRDDIGNGACEVVLVDDFEILKSTSPLSAHVVRPLRLLVAVVLLLRLVTWVMFPFLEYKYG